MTARLEHANLSVTDVDAMLGFILAAFPEFRERHDSGSADPERWVHVGDADTYIALNRVRAEVREARRHSYYSPGFNHLGFVVEDLDSLRARLLAGGYREESYPNQHPARRRAYFLDPQGAEWEFVQYLSADKTQQNDYLLP